MPWAIISKRTKNNMGMVKFVATKEEKQLLASRDKLLRYIMCLIPQGGKKHRDVLQGKLNYLIQKSMREGEQRVFDKLNATGELRWVAARKKNDAIAKTGEVCDCETPMFGAVLVKEPFRGMCATCKRPIL
jgi:hypothetical protein